MQQIRVSSMRAARLMALALFCAGPCLGHAATELVLNGGFETNSGTATRGFSHWTAFAQSGSAGDGGFYAQSGTLGPVTPFAVPLPPQGGFAGMTDQSGPGTYILYQDIALPAGKQALLSAQIFVQNEADDFAAPASLDFTVVPNQQARFDVVNPSMPVTSLGGAVLKTVYASQPGDAPMSGYVAVNANLTSLAGSTVRLRLAEVDNLQGLQFAIDAVSVQITPLPTPSTTTLTISPATTAFGATVTLSALIKGNDPTGTVVFTDGVTALPCSPVTLSSATSNSKTAVCTIGTLSMGAHTLAANYSGDVQNDPSAASGSHSVTARAAPIRLSSSHNPALVATTIDLNAQVVGSDMAATGSVTFFDGATPLGTVALSGDLATLSVSTLSLGVHAITATYSGDANYPAVSASINERIVATAAELSESGVPAPTLTPWALFAFASALLIAAARRRPGGGRSGA